MKIRRPVTWLATVLATAGCATAPSAPGPFTPHPGVEGEGVVGSWVHSGGYRRDYLVTRPDNLRPDSVYPLLIFLHGAGGTGAGLQRWINPDSATVAAGFIAVYPEGLDSSWEVGCGPCTSAGTQGVDDILFINTLIDRLSDSLPVDGSRIYLAGHSLGAQFVHYYACKSSRPPAAIAAVSGLWLRRTAVACPDNRDVSVLMIHGDQDPVLPWEGPRRDITALSMPEALERWSDLLECRPGPEVIEIPDSTGDGTSVQRTTVSGCRAGTRLELHRIRGGGHGWPGRARGVPALGPHSANLDGLTEILRFFGKAGG